MVILPDVSRTDGVAHNLCQRIKTDLPILLISRQENLNLNPEVFSLKGKKYVIVDYLELGWDWDREETLIVGKNTGRFRDACQSDSWMELDAFVRENPPVLYFKRELLAKDKTDTIIPIEYPNWQPEHQPQSFEEFNNRPIYLFHYWGRSHEGRLMAHGELWKHAAKNGYSVCDNVYYINNFLAEETNPKKIITLWIPHYARIEISELLKVNALSKLSLSLPGAGVKCFRSTGESLVNSVMILPEDDLAYSHDFIDGVNCVKFPLTSIDGIKKEWPIMKAAELALEFPYVLYNIYNEGLKAAKWYQVDNYVPNYLELNINKWK